VCRQLDCTCAVAEMLYVTGESWSGEVMESFSCAFANSEPRTCMLIAHVGSWRFGALFMTWQEITMRACNGCFQ
jgi:hypothetical protein